MNKRTTSLSRRRGMTTMELALILPIVLLLTMGIIEGGTMFYSWLTIQKAAQNGARFGATGAGVETGSRETQIIQVTQKWLVSLNNGSKEISLRHWPGTMAEGDGIDGSAGGPCQLMEVAVLYNYHPFTPIISAILPESVPLQGHDRKLNEPWKPCN